MNGAAPRVVALVPAWRAAPFIERTLDTLAAQTHPNLEILISDDASPDDTAARCEARAARDARFRVIRQPRNLGWTGNVNALLAAARGDYLVFAFQDDWPEPSYIAKCVAALESDPDAVMAFPDIVLIGQDGTREEKCYHELDGVTARRERARRVAAQQGSWWIPNRGVFRASAARALGGLRRHRRGEFSADWPWLLHMSLLGGFRRIPERLVTKIYQPRSLSRSWDFGFASWAAVTEDAARMVMRAPIPASEKRALIGTLAGCLAHHARRSGRFAIGRLLRRAGFRRDRPAPVATAPRA